MRSGRCEAVAVAPGTPSIADQETRDLVARGTYQRLAASGVLTTDGDRRVPRVSALVEPVMSWRPSVIVCDRFRLSELQDAVRGRVPDCAAVQRWSDSSEDVRACRRVALDGPLAIAAEARALLSASLAVAKVESDTSGNVRLTKRGTNNQARERCRGGAGSGGGAAHAAASRWVSAVGYLRGVRMSRFHHRPALKRGWTAIRARAIRAAGRRCTAAAVRGSLQYIILSRSPTADRTTKN